MSIDQILELAEQFHDAYERLAPEYGYETRPETAVAWDYLPDNNRSLMLAVVTEVVGPLLSQLREQRERAEIAERATEIAGEYADAARRTVGEQREALERYEGALRSVSATGTTVVESFAVGDAAGLAYNIHRLDLDLNVIDDALAALVPNTEGEGTGPTRDCPSCGTGWYFAAHRSTITCDCGTVVSRPLSPQVEGEGT